MKSLITIVFTIVLLCSLALATPPWTGVLDPTRAIDWSLAGAGVIPPRTVICSTLSPGATVAQINTALAGCTSGQTVFLSAGTYTGLTGNITCSAGVTLRGAGADKTFLVWATGGTGGIIYCVNADTNNSGDPHNTATWTGGYSQGATAITLGAVTLGNITNLRTGSLLILDQQDDASDPGNIFVTQDTGTNGTHTQGGGSAAGRPGTSPCNTPATCRSQMQHVTVVNCIGANSAQCSGGTATAPYTVTITPGLYAPNWRSGQSPGAWWSNSLPISGVGYENFSVDVRGVAQTGQGGVFYFQNGTYSWIKGVRVLNTVGAGCWKNHVRGYQSTHLTVRDSYFYGSCGANDSYAVDLGYGSADCLVENNIAQQIASPWIREGDTGSVFAYNFAINDFYTPSSGLWQQQSDYHHGPDYMGLREGQQGIGVNLDNIHNSGFMETVFRSYFPASEPGKTQNTEAVNINAYNRYANLVGNVLGTTNKHTIYSTNAPNATDAGSAANGRASIYTLGYSGNEGTRWTSGFTINNDTLVVTSLMRWGNCDAASGFNACRFVSGEVPSGISPYANPVPATNTLPASFYLVSQPAFWGKMPWPAIGPDIAGGNVSGVNGLVYRNPAARCYFDVMRGTADGTGSPLTFNSNCYAPDSTPELPRVWVDNNEALDGVNCGGFCSGTGYVAPRYEYILGSSAWTLGPPPGCTFGSPLNTNYPATGAGKQSFINAMEACRTATGAGIILDVPPGVYSLTAGVVIPQTKNTTANQFLVIRSTQDTLLAALPEPVCAGGTADNLTTSLPGIGTNGIGLRNPNCRGDGGGLTVECPGGGVLAYQLGAATFCIPAGSFTLANGIVTNTSAYNYYQYMYEDICTAVGPCSPFSLCSPSPGSTVPCAGTIGPDHWMFIDGAASPQAGSFSSSIIVDASMQNGNPTTLAQLASHIHFRRYWAHGDWTTLIAGSNSISAGFQFKGCLYCSLVGSQVSQVLRPGAEGHAVGGNGLTFKFDLDWLEGQSSCIFAGGYSVAPGFLPPGSYVPFKDVQVGRTRCTFPYSWLNATLAGNAHWGTSSIVRKNCNEMKEGIRVVFYGFICENVDNSGGQSGVTGVAGIRQTSGGLQGQNYQATITDLTIQNSIFRDACRDFTLNGRSAGDASNGGGVSMPEQRISMTGVLHYNLSHLNPNCPPGAPGLRTTSASQQWQVKVTENHQGTGATIVAVASVDAGAAAIGVVANYQTLNRALYLLNGPAPNGDDALCGGPSGAMIVLSGFANVGNNTALSGLGCGSSDSVLSTVGSILSGTGGLSAANAPFSAVMVGAGITITGAGASGGTLTTTIASFIDSSHVTLTKLAGTSTTTGTVTVNSLIFSNASAITEGPITPSLNNANPVLDASTASVNAAMGYQVVNILAGFPVSITSSPLVPGSCSAFAMSTHSVGGFLVPVGIGPQPLVQLASVGSSLWNGTFDAGNLTVTYPWTAPPDTVDSSGRCILNNVGGQPYSLSIVHNTFITDASAPVGQGPTPGGGPPFFINHLFRDSIMLNSGDLPGKAGWNRSTVSEGTDTETFNYDVTTMTADHLVWPRPAGAAALYTEYGNHPSFPDSAGCTGTGCSPPLTMFFPTTSCAIGFVNSCTGSVPLALADYHGYVIAPGSPFYHNASDGQSYGASITAIDQDQQTNLYVCPIPCGSPGPFPDITQAQIPLPPAPTAPAAKAFARARVKDRDRIEDGGQE